MTGLFFLPAMMLEMVPMMPSLDSQSGKKIMATDASTPQMMAIIVQNTKYPLLNTPAGSARSGQTTTSSSARAVP